MIKCWLHFIPFRYILSKLILITERKNVHVSCYIYMEHFKVVFLAQIIGHPDKTRRTSLWDPVVDHHQVIVISCHRFREELARLEVGYSLFVFCNKTCIKLVVLYSRVAYVIVKHVYLT